MEIDTIIWALEKLKLASLYRTPQDLTPLGEPWFSEFRNIPEDQFRYAVDKIVKNETSWPSIAIIYKYASIWTESKRKKDTCSYCEDTGFLLVKSKEKFIAYACNCPEGTAKRENLKIASYESLGIPWPAPIEKPSFSKKMSKENRQLIDNFLGRIGGEMPVVDVVEDEALWRMMGDGSLE